ncbi:hypothetical protein GH733_019355 [Mirounga leonina]|nr:hypothetical protein GH733_019355 [Mirounga leonina]
MPMRACHKTCAGYRSRLLSSQRKELHILKVTGQETVAQIKDHGTSLEGITPEDQVVLLAGTPLEVEATLGQCKVDFEEAWEQVPQGA